MTILAVVGLSAAAIVLLHAKDQGSEIAGLQKELAEQKGRNPEKRDRELDTVRQDLGAAKKKIKKLKDKLRIIQIGFIPCWRREQQEGRLYYYAYNVTYAYDHYRIASHSDLDRGVPIIEKALSDDEGERLLKNPPAHDLDRSALIEFGRKIAAWREGAYPNGCQLVTTLNPEAPVGIARFISREVGLYPIARQR